MRLPINLFSEALRLPDNAMIYDLAERIRILAHDQAVLQTQDYDFDPTEFANSGGCEVRPRLDVPSHWQAVWTDQKIRTIPIHAVFDVVWRGKKLTLIRIDPSNDSPLWIIVADSIVLCETFFVSVCRWGAESSDAVLVFDDGYFSRDAALRDQISSRKLEDLQLNSKVVSELQTGVLNFFELREVYANARIPWKRGVILHGPPGNGKTQAIQGLINELQKPVIYVKSLTSSGERPEDCLKTLFDRAREIAPCLMILEDIDSLVNDSNRSFFLNEMDGLRPLNGVLTIATTNHLESLDIAIRSRPSRFDQKIEFSNPGVDDRLAYLKSKTVDWATKDKKGLMKVANDTEGHSFAALQELVRGASIQRFLGAASPFLGLVDVSVKSQIVADKGSS